MELSTYLFIVLFTAAFIAAFVMWRNMQREKRKNECLSALINTGQIYTITWSTDFRHIEVNEALSKFLKETGMKADEAFLKRLFLDDASIGTTGGVLLMGAMVKTGRKTSFTMPDGSEKKVEMYRHYNSTTDHISESFDKMLEGYFETGVAKKVKLGDAECILCDAKGIFEVT